MNKTIEEAAISFIKENRRIVGNEAPLVWDVVEHTVNHILSLPLAERLTEEEREKIKNIYHECELIEMDDNPNLPAYKIEQAGTKMALLESIFGEDFFKEKT